jgi:hypothetical protein
MFILSLHALVNGVQGLGEVRWEGNFISAGLITKQVSQLRLFRREQNYMLFPQFTDS